MAGVSLMELLVALVILAQVFRAAARSCAEYDPGRHHRMMTSIDCQRQGVTDG